MIGGTSYNTAYTLRAYTLALRDVAPFVCNVVYAETLADMALENHKLDTGG